MGNCCDAEAVAVDTPSAPLLPPQKAKSNSVYMPTSSDHFLGNSIKSTASSIQHRITAEQAFLNHILQSTADQVIDITSIDVASNPYDYLERAQMYEVKIPQVIADESSMVQPKLHHYHLSLSSVDAPDIVLSEVGGVTGANLRIIEEHSESSQNDNLIVAHDDQLVIEFTLD